MTDSQHAVKKMATGIAILAGLAVPITVYLIYAHFAPEASDFCNFGASFNCEIVNQSLYSEILGIPVAVPGMLTYLFLFFLALNIRASIVTGLRGRWSIPARFKVLAGVAGIGTAFSLYLTYIEAFVLYTWCIFCLTQQFIIVTILILSLVALRKMGTHSKPGSPEPEKKVCEFC